MLLTIDTFVCAYIEHPCLDCLTMIVYVSFSKPPKVTHHCGNKIPQAVYADTQWLFVTFVSDATETSTGFSASFIMKNTQKGIRPEVSISIASFY